MLTGQPIKLQRTPRINKSDPLQGIIFNTPPVNLQYKAAQRAKHKAKLAPTFSLTIPLVNLRISRISRHPKI